MAFVFAFPYMYQCHSERGVGDWTQPVNVQEEIEPRQGGVQACCGGKGGQAIPIGRASLAMEEETDEPHRRGVLVGYKEEDVHVAPEEESKPCHGGGLAPLQKRRRSRGLWNFSECALILFNVSLSLIWSQR